jgi:glycosyltransferase involved in cell wall biosynthesis
LRILHIYKDYYPVLGGIENYVRQLAEDQARRGHSVEVLVTNLSRQTVTEVMTGVSITKTSRWLNVSSAPVSPRLAIELFRRLYSQTPPDIIHLHAPYPVGELAWLVGSWLPRFAKNRPKTVITYHSDIIKQKKLLRFYAPILRRVLKRVDRVIPTSATYILSSPFLARVPEKCTTIPLGVEVARFLQPDEIKVTRIKEQFPEKIGLFVGRLRYYKSLNYLIEAMLEVEPTAKLLIIGVGQMEQKWKNLTESLGLAERVIFLGEVSDAEKAAYYAACDVFVLPSAERSEAFGAVLVEAMASGKPVISTELGTGTSWVNQHGETGLVVPPRDPHALATALNTILSDPELAAKFGQHGRNRALHHFNQTLILDQIEELYQTLME